MLCDQKSRFRGLLRRVRCVPQSRHWREQRSLPWQNSRLLEALIKVVGNDCSWNVSKKVSKQACVPDLQATWCCTCFSALMAVKVPCPTPHSRAGSVQTRAHFLQQTSSIYHGSTQVTRAGNDQKLQPSDKTFLLKIVLKTCWWSSTIRRSSSSLEKLSLRGPRRKHDSRSANTIAIMAK